MSTWAVIGFWFAWQDERAKSDEFRNAAQASLLIVVGIALPFRGIVDARRDVARVPAFEERTATDYAAAREFLFFDADC